MRSSPIRRKSLRVSGATPFAARAPPRTWPLTVLSPSRVALPTAERAAACSRAELPALREAELLEEAERSREEAATFARSVDSTGRATRLEDLREEDDVPREAVPVEVRRLSWLEAEVAGAEEREELPEVLRPTEEEPRLLEEDELREDEAEDPLLRVVEVLREPEELLDCA